MRSLSGANLTAQQQPLVNPAIVLTARDEVLHFAAFASSSAGTLDTQIAQSLCMRNTGTLAYATYRHTNGNAYLRVFDTASSGDYALPNTVTSLAVQTMRSAIVNEGGTIRLYAATMDGSGVQVKRATLSSTTNNVSVALSNYSSVFGDAFSNNATRVRRVEAVCPTDYGVIVAVGTHDFTLKLSTIQFYWIAGSSSAAVALNTIIQIPMLDADVYSDWWTCAKYCSYITAIANTDTGAIHVIANDQSTGRAVQFYLKSGIESALVPVAPISASATLLGLLPCSLTRINGTFTLTARFTRQTRVSPSSTIQVAALDLYLQSADGWNWSLYERSSFLTKTDCRGALLLRNDSPSTIYYAGGGQGYAAFVTQLQAPASSAANALDDYIESIQIEESAEAADQLTLSIADPSTAGGGMMWDGSAHVRNGSVLYLKLGYDGSAESYAAYGIDDLQRTAMAAGETSVDHGALAISARDLGQKKLIDHNLLTETDLRGQRVLRTLLATLDDFNVKTPDFTPPASLVENDQSAKPTKKGLVYTGRNQSFIALVDSDESGDALMEATVQMDAGDNYAVSALGFVFGCDDDGNGNVVLVPRYNTWTAFETCDRPRVRALKLNSIDPDDPEKEDTGWKFKDKANMLWGWATPLAAGLRTQAVSGTYRTSAANALAKGYLYDVAVRVSGRRVQVFVKPRVTGAATWAANAQYQLWSEFLFDWQAKRSQAGDDLCGLALSTDVAGAATWFAQGEYGDVSAQLTDASTLALSDYTRLAANGTYNGIPGSPSDGIGFATTPSVLKAGMTIRLLKASHMDQLFTINTVGGTSITLYNYRSTTPASINAPTSVDRSVAVYVIDAGTDTTGSASSGARKDAVTGGMVWTETRAGKRALPCWYRGAFVTDDTTAIAMRLVQTDANLHLLKTGSTYFPGGTWEGWDYPTYPDKNNARAWRLVAHGGKFFDGAASQFGLPASAYFDIDDECLRYAELPAVAGYLKRGALPGDTAVYQTGVYCPAAYTPLAGTGGATSVLTQFRSYGGKLPGDAFDQLATTLNTPLAGLKVDIVTRDGDAGDGNNDAANNIYASSAAGGTQPTLTLNKPYPNAIQGAMVDIDNPGTSQADKDKAISGALAIVSGRAQLNTAKNSHASDAMVLYSPRDSAGAVSKITVSRWARYAGLFQPVEDAIRRLCALAGVRNPVFRNDHTTPTTNWSGTIGTSPTSLPLRANLANFTLDAQVHIPGNDTNGSGITNERRLNIFFRGYYRLSIQQYATAADYAAGRPGVIRIGLATTSTDIAVDAGGDRWLKVVPIPDTDVNVAGTLSGSNPNYTLSEVASQLVDLRVAVSGPRVVVEINRKPFWTLHLDDMTDGTTSWRRDDAGAIQVSYTGTVPSYTATIRVLELGDEIAQHTAQKGSSTASNIDTIKQNRHIRARSTAAGGVEFSRFWVRDDAGTLGENAWKHIDGASDTVQRAHVEITGTDISGEYVDELLAQSLGVQFASIGNETVIDWQAAGADAQLQMREAGEFADVDSIEAVPLLHVQPEDKLALAYAPGGDAPAHASSAHVITSKSTRASVDETGNRTWESAYQIRGFRS
jgi:hypothetical protein